jgi:hypothetical protein
VADTEHLSKIANVNGLRILLVALVEINRLKIQLVLIGEKRGRGLLKIQHPLPGPFPDPTTEAWQSPSLE